MIFHQEKNHIEKLFNQILADKTVISKDSIENPRVMVFDEVNKKLLSEGAIRAVCDYELELRNCFTVYISENFQFGKVMLTWRELQLQNKGMSPYALIKFLKDADLIPNLLNIENLEEIMMKIVPPTSSKEHEF